MFFGLLFCFSFCLGAGFGASFSSSSAFLWRYFLLNESMICALISEDISETFSLHAIIWMFANAPVKQDMALARWWLLTVIPPFLDLGFSFKAIWILVETKLETITSWIADNETGAVDVMLTFPIAFLM